MQGLWATLGICCLDPQARADILRNIPRRTANGTIALAKLKPLQRHMRTQFELDLSRWELKELYRFWRPKQNNRSASNELANVGHFYSKTIRVADLELCRVVGLSLIDMKFRKRLYRDCRSNAANIGSLQSRLAGRNRTPRFRRLRASIRQNDYKRLNRLIAKGRRVQGHSVVYWMAKVEELRWKSPGWSARQETACSPGHYIEPPQSAKPYWHVCQPEFDDLLIKNRATVRTPGARPMSILSFLKKHGAIV